MPQLLDGEPPSNSGAVRVAMMPGLTWKYSGGGTTIAQQAMVDVTGTPFPELLRELVIEPCGMGDATFEQPLPERLYDFAAIGHLPDGAAVPGRWHTYPEMAAAGLWCAPKDLVAFASTVQDAVAAKDDPILPIDLAQLLVTADCPDVSDRMAVGFFLSGKDGAGSAPDRFGHGGGDHGFITDLSADINGHRAAAAMVHSLGGGEVLQAAMRAAGSALGWQEPDAGPLGSLTQAQLMAAFGAYATEDGRVFELALGEGGVTLAVPGQPPMPLDMITVLTWTTRLGLSLTFEAGEEGVTGIVMHHAGTTLRATRQS